MQQGRNRGRWQRRSALWLAVAAFGLFAGPAGAEPELADPPGADPAVPLDKLLRLPAGTRVESRVERRGGHTRGEWEARFREARQQHLDAETALGRTRDAIGEKAAKEGGQWRMAAPGLGAQPEAGEAGQSPLDYRLTQELRRNREEVSRSERRLQDLQVEANLAAVPADWRGETEADAPPDAP